MATLKQSVGDVNEGFETASVLAESMASQGPPRPPGQALPPRDYLEQTVVPLLSQALQSLSRERPVNPIEYLAVYLLEHNPQK
eukprot:m51a1_g6769 putative dpy-30 domain containing protein (83) ;mRNA; f:107976-108224